MNLAVIEKTRANPATRRAWEAWSYTEDDALLARAASGHTIGDIAQAHSRTPNGVRTRLMNYAIVALDNAEDDSETAMAAFIATLSRKAILSAYISNKTVDTRRTGLYISNTMAPWDADQDAWIRGQLTDRGNGLNHVATKMKRTRAEVACRIRDAIYGGYPLLCISVICKNNVSCTDISPPPVPLATP